jgi:outer membrane protein assembly factor BamB
VQLAETDWLMPRGNAARNGVMTVTDDRELAGWQSPVATVYDVTRFPTDVAETENDRDLQKAVTASRTTIAQQKRASIPGSQPLFVDGTMYVRTIGNIQALDPVDGSKRWETFFDATIEKVLGKSENAVPGPTQARTMQMLVSQRLWGDSTYGSLSSDGRFLYAVEELGLSSPIYRPQQPPLLPSPANTLVAYYIGGDRRVGQRAWMLGGPKGDPDFENPLAGVFFLGPPLPLAGHLYCLGEAEGEIRLLVIDPARPDELVWSQPLAGAGRPIHQDVGRRTAGTVVSYADGVMVCPTDAGYVIGVDLTQRSLLWGYQYQPAINNPRRPFPLPRPPRPVQRSWWLDSAATIADGNVLLTPRGGNDVICLDLLDGTEKWKKTKQDGLYLAGVVDSKVLLVGTKTVQALSLKDGSAAWKKETALPTPSGRGFIRDGRLYLPLSTAQIAVVDIATGKVLSSPETPREIVPGNMITTGNAIISQGVDRIDLFPFPESEKQVANK